MLTLERIKQAYEMTGLKPIQRTCAEMGDLPDGTYGPVSACAIRVVELAEQVPHQADRPYLGGRLGLSHDYVKGFVRGFDGYSTEQPFPLTTDEQLEGYLHGQIAAAALFSEKTADCEAADAHV